MPDSLLTVTFFLHALWSDLWLTYGWARSTTVDPAMVDDFYSWAGRSLLLI